MEGIPPVSFLLELSRSREEERGSCLRGLAALVLPLPGLPPSPSGASHFSSPRSKGGLLSGGSPKGPGQRGGSGGGGVSVPGLDVPSASVLLQLLGIMEVAVSVSPCLTVYNMATFL